MWKGDSGSGAGGAGGRSRAGAGSRGQLCGQEDVCWDRY